MTKDELQAENEALKAEVEALKGEVETRRNRCIALESQVEEANKLATQARNEGANRLAPKEVRSEMQDG